MNTATRKGQNQPESTTRGKGHSRIAKTSLKSERKSTIGNNARNKKNRLHKKKWNEMTEKIAQLNQKLSTMNNNESKINQTVNKTMHINVKKNHANVTRMLIVYYRVFF